MNVTLHLTNACNMACRYCYAKRGERTDMSLDTAKQAIRFAAKTSRGFCGIIFFGGEPLLREDLVRDAVAFARDSEEELGTRFHFKITTNGLRLDDGFLAFARENKVHIALSLDGTKAAHDAHRVTPDGRGTWDRLNDIAGKLLESAPYSPVLSTVTPETVGRFSESFDWMLDRGFRYLICSLNYAGAWTEKTIRILRKQYEKIAKSYERRTRAERKFYFSPFDSKIRSRVVGPDDGGRCALGMHQVSIEPDGTVVPCVQFVGKGPEYQIGHVNTGLDEVRRRELFMRSHAAKPDCSQCAIEPRCNHVCACLQFQTTGKIDGVSPVLCAHERIVVPIADRLAERLFRDRDPMFIQKHYNAAFPLLSLIEDGG